MDPTLKDGERVVVNIIGYKLGGVEKGNVIVFHANKKDDYVKRVIGTPGDSVEYKNDTLYVNGKKQSEPYLNYNENVSKLSISQVVSKQKIYQMLILNLMLFLKVNI